MVGVNTVDLATLQTSVYIEIQRVILYANLSFRV